jgi:tetratricopeptide (TPR) repeat protein
MNYPGNPSLPADVQQRIRSTFDHTLSLAEKGSRQEALLGCDFVLRMDPLFEPARRLHERLDSSAGPLAVDDLRRSEEPPPPLISPPPSSSPPATGRLPEVPESLWADLEELAGGLPELPAAPAAPAPPPAAVRPSTGALRAEFESLLAERRFQELQMRAGREAAAVTGDLELQRLVTLAQERLEAGPYVSKFLLSAREAVRTGNTAEAKRLIDKARTLDPTHPGIAEMEAATGRPRGTAAAATAAAGPTSAGGGAPAPSGPAPVEPEMRTQPITGLPAGSAGAAAGTGAGATIGAGAGATIGAGAGATIGAGAVAAATIGAGAAASAGAGQPPPATWPQAAPPAPVPPPLTADSESERRIRQLLDEGQSALDGGDPQAAIDAWSRIFLIDIDHQEAARRIEKARRAKAERDRQVEETFHDGLARLEARDAAGARSAFQRVLELQPGHLQSREYLQQLDEGHLPAVPPGSLGGAGAAGAAGGRQAAAGPSPLAPPLQAQPSPRSAAGMPPLPVDLAAATAAGQAPPQHELQEEILVPPDLSEDLARSPEARRETRPAGAAARQGRARRLFLVVGSAVLLLALAVGWFLYQKREQWFPNSRTQERTQPPAPNPIPRATKLYGSGRVVMAMAQLSRVQPGDSHYKEAQALLAKWQSEQNQGTAPGTPAPGSPSAPPGAPGTAGPAAGGGAVTGAVAAGGGTGAGGPEADRRRTLIDDARKAYQGGSYLLAAERYEAANRIARLEAGDSGQLTNAKQRLVPLQREVALFHDHEWELAIPSLWRLHESDPANRDVARMIVDSYYNLGVRDLQHNDPRKAAEKFAEARSLAPDDPELKRQLLFAQTYQERGPDLLYKIYTRYLPIR